MAFEVVGNQRWKMTCFVRGENGLLPEIRLLPIPHTAVTGGHTVGTFRGMPDARHDP